MNISDCITGAATTTAQMTTFWTFWLFLATSALATVTGFLWWVAKRQLTALQISTKSQLEQLNITSSATFLLEFKKTFFTNENRQMFELIDEGRIKYYYHKDDKGEETQYFETTDDEEKKRISTYEMDDFLGHFEDMGLFEQQKVVDLEMIYEGFDYLTRFNTSFTDF
jgi:hypothetical protein